ncbi:MAG: hypothetical protein C5B50_13845 [Verrucomicrobia bacterium]|nr:MAG: hypothetical protein C5B50_13845 [Verrucomicrobiota bacterium]
MGTTPLCPSCGKPLAPSAPKGLCQECLLKAGFPSGNVTEGGAEKPHFVPPPIEELAAKIPQLEILELIGRGGMGAVYKARQKQLGRIVALKILPPGAGDQSAFAERFTREARALAALNHPGIVTLYEFGQANGLYFFLMEFVDGVNLCQLLEAGRISAREALAIVPQICDALQYAHDQGIIHRDIKPENILLDRKGRVKVADFGLARLMQSEAEPAAAGKAVSAQAALTEAGKVMGTPHYMAPEQKEKPTEVDHRADIYALGVVFYQMLTGELPAAKIEPPSKKILLDVRLDEIVLRALEKEPQRRYQQASALKTQVETIAADSESTSAPDAPVGVPLAEAEAFGEGTNATLEPRAFPPRYSRTAIVGAVWAAAGVLLALLTNALVAAGPSNAFLFVAIPMAAIYLTAPFGAAILGLIAISQIRRSGGRIYGLPLALFAVLFFPILVLDMEILIVVGDQLDAPLHNWCVTHGLGGYAEFVHALFFWFRLGMCVFIDWIIARAVWRAAKAPIKSDTISEGRETSQPGSNALTQALLSLQRPSVRVALWIIAALCILNFALPHKLQLHEYRVGATQPWLFFIKQARPDGSIAHTVVFNPLSTAFSSGIICVLIALGLFVTRASKPTIQRSEVRGQRSEVGNQGLVTSGGAKIVLTTVLVMLAVLATIYLVLGRERARLAAQLERKAMLDNQQLRDTRSGSVIESVVVDNDKAVVKARQFKGEGMIFMFGAMTNRWEAGHPDSLFAVSIEWPWFGHGANWVIRSAHGHIGYNLHTPTGTVTGEIVFHPGTPAPETDGSYVIGEFQPLGRGASALPIAVKLVKDKPAQPAPPGVPAPSASASNIQDNSNTGNSSSKPDYVKALPVFYAIAGIAELLDGKIKEHNDPELASQISSQLLDRGHEYNNLVGGTEVEIPSKILTAWSKLPDALRAGRWDEAASLLSVGSKDPRLLEPLQELAKRQTARAIAASPVLPSQPDYAKASQLFRSVDTTASGLAEAIDKKDDPKQACGLASQLLQQLHAYNELVAGTQVELPQEHMDELATVPDELKAGNWDDAKTALDDGVKMNDDLSSRLQELLEQQTQQSVRGVSLSAAKFGGPTCVAVDRSGNLYVTDSIDHTIRKIATNGIVTTLAGNGLFFGQNGLPEGGYADGPGTAARFEDPFGIAVDDAGNVYVGDFANDAVRKISPTGMVSTLAGLPGTPGSTDGSGSAARFRRPHGVAVDHAGNVYVADTDNGTIRKVTPGGMVITLAGKAGEYGNVDGRGDNARFNGPHGVAIDRAGNVFVADSDNHTIRCITPEGVVTTLAGTPRKKGSADGAARKARFYGPYAVAVDDQGNLYVADTSNGTIRQIALAGTNWIVSTIAGLAGIGGNVNGSGSAARFSTPDGLAVDGSGNVYVADYTEHTIRKLTRAGTNWVVTDLLGKDQAKDDTRGSLDQVGRLLGKWQGTEVAGTNIVVVQFFGEGTTQFTVADKTPVIGRYLLLDSDHMKLEYAGEDTIIVEFVISGETLTLKLTEDETMTLRRAR